MADQSEQLSRRAVFRGALGVAVLGAGAGAGAALAGCGAAEKPGVTTGPYGVAVWAITYRGTIHPDQRDRGPARAGWPAAGYDVAAGVDFVPHLAEHAPVDLDGQRTVLLGHSAGGHLATWAASRSQLEEDQVGAHPTVKPLGCVSMAGVYDLIPAHQARDYVSAATAGHDPAELSVVANADHNSWTVPDHPAWSVARGHVLELVGL